jgi:hypothetical protein
MFHSLPRKTTRSWVIATIPGWWYTYPSEKYEFVSWDDELPNIWKVIKAMFQTTNQIYSPSINHD